MKQRTGFLEATAWNHAGRLIEYCLTYLFSVLIARKLGAEQNGAYASFLALAQLLVVLSSAGTDAALNRFLPQLEENGAASYLIRRLLALKGLLFLFFALVALAARGEFLRWFSLQSLPVQYIGVLLAFAFAKIFSSSFTSIWLARFTPRPIYFVSNGVLATQIAYVLFGIQSHAPMQDVLPVIAAGAGVVLILNAVFGRRYYMAAASPIPMKPAYAYSGWLWMNSMLEYILGKQGDVALLSFFAVERSGIGQYDVAHTLSQLPGFALSAGFAGISISMFAKLAHENTDRLLPFWKSLSRLLTQLTIPLYCFAGVFAPEIIRAIYSAEYVPGTVALQILIAARIASRLFGGGENTEAVLALNGEKSIFGLSVIGGALNLGLNIVLIPMWGIAGAAAATGLTTISVNFGSWSLLKRRIANPLMGGHWLAVFLVGAVPPLLIRSVLGVQNFAGLCLAGFFSCVVWVPGIYFIRRKFEDSDSHIAFS